MATSTMRDDNYRKDKDTMSQSKGNTSFELIKEKMKEKRRKKALNDGNTSWSRSFSKKKGTSASFVLKASLRSNNQSLAKALAASRHEAQQAHHSVLELQRERQYLLQQANSTRQAEKECMQRFGNIKQVLTKVTHSLLDAVSSLGQALDLCSSLPLRDSSLGILPRASMTSDDDSFGIAQKASQGLSTYSRQTRLVSKAIESAASNIMDASKTMATATIHQSESPSRNSQSKPAPGSSRSEGPTKVSQSESTVNTVDQSEPVLEGVGQSKEMKDLADEEFELDFPSLDDADFHLMFTEETPDNQGVGSCDSRHQSHCLEAPVKRSRTATVLDPIAIKKALADDGDNATHTKDPGEDATTILSPHPEPPFQQPPGEKTQASSPLTHQKKHLIKSPDKRPAITSRRMTYNVTLDNSDSASNKTFEVQASPFIPLVPNQQAGAVKERYVFVHSPPCNASKYKSLDTEPRDATSHSVPTQDEHSISQADKTRFNHDEQVIRPWGNIQVDKPCSSSSAIKPKLKSKPSANTSRSLLPKPPKKETSKDPAKICQTKHTKTGLKKLSKKTALMSESFRNDLAIFDLSAGDSFSLAPPVLKRVKPKPTSSLAEFSKTNNDQDGAPCLKKEKPTEVHSPHDGKQGPPADLVVPGKALEPVHQEELLNPMPQREESHLAYNKHIKQAEPTKPTEAVNSERGGKIKRKSKKAKSVVSPTISKMAATSNWKTELNLAAVKSESKASDIFDGICLGEPSRQTGKAKLAPSWKPAEDVDDAILSVASAQPTKHHPTKRVKAKALHVPQTEGIIDRADTASTMLDNVGKYSTLHRGKTSTNKAKPSVTFEQTDPVQANHREANEFLFDISAPHGLQKTPPSKKSASPHLRSPSPSTVAEPIAPSKVGSDSERGPSVVAMETNSQTVTNNSHPHQAQQGRKRTADALVGVQLASERGEEESEAQETGRRSRRAVPISYKEPSLRDKLRRDHSPTKKKTKTKKVKSKPTALATVTNVL
ncbi:uncharacterized protein LOC110973474 [Acanthaster planci]|uniref:Uncharacterized protein LOC110973474 n=1 Tax=Acanthaster planci TaxID=133434 RepID=A0A8B7XII0_ACAPL|nr:uncharacterized protein LOC110973474 [Acanthaster planci]